MALGDSDLDRTAMRTLTRSRQEDPELLYQLHPSAKEPRATVLLTHGFLEHQQRYAEVIRSWGDRGILVATYDLRGHGLSGGTRGHVDRFSDYVRDAAELLDVLALDPVWRALSPPVLFGHSLGGLIAIHLALARPELGRGLCLSSPFLGFAKEVPGGKQLAGRVFSHLAPALSLPTGLKGSDVTRNSELAESYDRDPLNGKVASARWFTETKAAQAFAMERAPELTLPLFCLAAGDDKVVSVDTTSAFFERAGGTEKQFRKLPGLYHEIMNEPERAEIIESFAEAILAWRPVLRDAKTEH